MKTRFDKLDESCMASFLDGSIIISFDLFNNEQRLSFVKEFLLFLDLYDVMWGDDIGSLIKPSEKMYNIVMLKCQKRYNGSSSLAWFSRYDNLEYELLYDIYHIKPSDRDYILKCLGINFIICL